MPKISSQKYNAFTFPEALLVLGAISLVTMLVFVVVKPDLQFQKARDIKRNNDVLEIMDAISAYKAENLGKIPDEITHELKLIGTSNENCEIKCGEEYTNGCIDLEKYVSPTYIEAVPYDPIEGSPDKTFYAIKLENTERFEIRSCTPELVKGILITR